MSRVFVYFIHLLGAIGLAGANPIAYEEACQKEITTSKKIEVCISNETAKKNLQKVAGQLAVDHGKDIAKEVRDGFLVRAKNSLYQELALLQWLSSPSVNASLFQDLKPVSAKCGFTANKGLSELEKPFEQKQVTRVLGLEQVSAEKQNLLKEQIHKRLLMAWMQANWLEGIGIPSASTELQKQKYQDTLIKIRQVYPLVGHRGAYAFGRVFEEEYGSHGLGSSDLKPPDNLEEILFADSTTSEFKPIHWQNPSTGFSRVGQMIFGKPISDKMKKALEDLLIQSMRDRLESLKAFCELSPCEVIGLNIQLESNDSRQIESESTYRSQREMLTQAACSCGFKAKVVNSTDKTRRVLAGLAMSGLVSCPLSYGVGCLISVASGLGLAGFSAADTVQSYNDYSHLDPIIKATSSLPGLSEASKEKLKDLQSENNQRLVTGATETILSAAPIGSLKTFFSRFKPAGRVAAPQKPIDTGNSMEKEMPMKTETAPEITPPETVKAVPVRTVKDLPSRQAVRRWLAVSSTKLPPDDVPYLALGFGFGGRLRYFGDQMQRVFNHEVGHFENLGELRSISIERWKELYDPLLKFAGRRQATASVKELPYIQIMENTVREAKGTKCILFNLEAFDMEKYRKFVKGASETVTDHTNIELKYILEHQEIFDHVRWFKNGKELSLTELKAMFGDFNPDLF